MKHPELNDAFGPDAREQSRSSMFLAAVMRTETEQVPVKVRNMSRNGAMIESPLAPRPGTSVRLIRGALIAQAVVVWSSNNRCGLQFSSELSVKDWLAAPIKAEQQRVDGIVALVKAGAPPSLAVPDGAAPLDVPRSGEQLVDDLRAVLSLMEDLEDDLASSGETVARHGDKLQNLDIAMQIIRAIAEELTSPRSGESMSLAKLTDLRVACSKALGTP